jgi:translocation and assembly module TamB
VQVSSGGGGDEGIGVMSLLSNVSVTAGKQIGSRTFLRLETGVCRSTASAVEAQALNLWYGIAAEYRIAPGLTGQIGVDPGPSPCGALVGMTVRRMQVGLDLFKEWVF